MSHAERRRRSFAGIAVAGLLVLAACGKDDGTSPEPPPPPPASLQKAAGDSQSVTVGTTLPVNPSVKVLAADGRPVRGVTVNFAVQGGGGTITGATPVTDANGVATLGSWRVGTTSGPNGLTVTVGTLPTISFEAFGRPGPAVALLKMEGSDNNGAFVDQVLVPPPVVRVVDAYGNGISGVVVSFAVTSGGGTLTGPIPVTNVEGYTGALSWRLGATPGPNTLRGSTTGMAPVDFTATAYARCTPAPVEPETAVSGALTTTDCTDGQFYYDHYTVAVPQVAAMSFTLNATAFDAFLVLHDDAGMAIAANDDFQQSTNSRIKALLAPGQYEAAVTSYWWDEVGPYEFSARATTASIENCEQVWAVPGIVTAQSIRSTDCRDDDLGTFDWVLVVLRGGVPVTIGVASTEWTTFVAVYGSGGPYGQSETGTFTFTPNADGLYGILASSAGGQFGNYTLSISAAAPSASVAGASLAVPRGEGTGPTTVGPFSRGEKAVGPVQAIRDMVWSPASFRERQAVRARADARRATTRP